MHAETWLIGLHTYTGAQDLRYFQGMAWIFIFQHDIRQWWIMARSWPRFCNDYGIFKTSESSVIAA
jgi:hypothetical protein